MTVDAMHTNAILVDVELHRHWQASGVISICGRSGEIMSMWVKSERRVNRGIHEKISGKTAIMLMNRPGSDSVRYGLKVDNTPRRIKVAYNGSCLRRIIMQKHR